MYHCTSFTQTLSAPQASEHTSTACVCSCNVATVYKSGVGHTSSGLPATDETATSFAKFGKCTLRPRSAHYVLKGHAAAAVHVNGLAE